MGEVTKKERAHGSGSSRGTYYKVEVRTTYHEPTVLQSDGGQRPFVIDDKWREWPVYLGAQPFGTNIPVKSWNRHAAEHGLLSHEVAEAHRWALIAMLEAHQSALCVETRLVAVEFSEEYSTREIGVTALMAMPRRPWDDFAPRDDAALSSDDPRP